MFDYSVSLRVAMPSACGWGSSRRLRQRERRRRPPAG